MLRYLVMTLMAVMTNSSSQLQVLQYAPEPSEKQILMVDSLEGLTNSCMRGLRGGIHGGRQVGLNQNRVRSRRYRRSQRSLDATWSNPCQHWLSFESSADKCYMVGACWQL
jgi:hypothetical protein